MFQLTAQDSRVCRSPDPTAKSADETGVAAGETLSLGSNNYGKGTTSAFKVNGFYLSKLYKLQISLLKMFELLLLFKIFFILFIHLFLFDFKALQTNQ